MRKCWPWFGALTTRCSLSMAIRPGGHREAASRLATRDRADELKKITVPVSRLRLKTGTVAVTGVNHSPRP